MIIGALVLAGGLFVQRHTAFGRYSQAIGAGEPATYASGVRVDRHKIIACTLSGALGFAGVILAGRLASGSPSSQTSCRCRRSPTSCRCQRSPR